MYNFMIYKLPFYAILVNCLLIYVFETDHPWIKDDGEAPDKPLDNAVLNRLKQFRAMNQFKKVALRVMLFRLNFFQRLFS